MIAKYERFKNGVNLDYIIFPQNKFIRIWDWVVFICLFFVIFVTPYQIGVTGGYDLFYSTVWFTINLMVSIIFLIDTCLYFFRPYIADGKTNITFSTIRKSYLKDMFIPNLLSSIPYALIFYLTSRDTFNTYNDPMIEIETIHPSRTFILVFQLSTLLRLIRFHKILKAHGPITDFKMRSNNQLTALIMNLCKLLIISHWFACVWCWIAYLQNKCFLFTGTQNWIGAYIESNSDDNGVLLSRFPDPNGVSIASGLDRYVLALYWSIQTITSIGYGNFSPVTVLEWWTGSLLQLVAGIAWAYFIGSFVDIAAAFNGENREFEQRCDYANDLIRDFEPESECVFSSVVSRNTNIGGDEVAKRIRKYIHKQYRQSKRSTYECTINDRYPILDSLSPDLRKIASVLLLKSKLEEISYLSSSFLSIEEQSEVVMQCQYLDFSSGEIYDVSGPRRGIFIIMSGIGSLGLKDHHSVAGKKLLHENTIVGRGSTLMEDNHPLRKKVVLSFLTYSQVLFIPRPVILEALEKNDRAAWKGSGRWIYARTVLRERFLNCA